MATALRRIERRGEAAVRGKVRCRWRGAGCRPGHPCPRQLLLRSRVHEDVPLDRRRARTWTGRATVAGGVMSSPESVRIARIGTSITLNTVLPDPNLDLRAVGLLCRLHLRRRRLGVRAPSARCRGASSRNGASAWTAPGARLGDEALPSLEERALRRRPHAQRLPWARRTAGGPAREHPS